jgi:hypothetical protein
MAVVPLTPKEVDYNGVEGYSDTTDYKAATAIDGYTFVNDGKTIINIKNDGTSGDLVATVDNPQPCDFGGTTVHDVEITIPQNDDFIAGPFPKHRFNDADGKVTITLSQFDTITACAFKLTS